jgi:hypothetical protein
VRLRTYLAATLAALAASPAAAPAATTTFGADLGQEPAQGCSTTPGAQCAYVTSAPRVGSASSAAAPQTGLVTRLRLRTDGPAATYRVQVLAGSALMVTTLQELAVHVPAGPRTTTVWLGAGGALPISAGERLGVAVTVPSGGGSPLFRAAAAGGATCERRGPDTGMGSLLSGLAIDTYSSAGCQGEALVAATIEFDQDGDGLGDQTQDIDDDSDGVRDRVDNCAGVANPDQATAAGARVGVACAADPDGDDVANLPAGRSGPGSAPAGGGGGPAAAPDNCPGVPNVGQLDGDGDGDGHGDAATGRP